MPQFEGENTLLEDIHTQNNTEQMMMNDNHQMGDQQTIMDQEFIPVLAEVPDTFSIQHIVDHVSYGQDERGLQYVAFKCYFALEPIFPSKDNNEKAVPDKFYEDFISLQRIVESTDEMNAVHLQFYCDKANIHHPDLRPI